MAPMRDAYLIGFQAVSARNAQQLAQFATPAQRTEPRLLRRERIGLCSEPRP